jgi:hypothetical protein
LAVVDER